MFAWENPEDRVAIVQMNAELRHAQLELLSAECATHQLRLRFSNEDLAGFAERDVLQKAITTASRLNQYYASIQKLMPAEAVAYGPSAVKLSGEHILECIARIAQYLSAERKHYFPSGMPLRAEHRAVVQSFFSAALLDRIRIVELSTTRIPNPPFYPEARALGFANLPDIPHMSSVTFLDVVVFNESITDRALFHALVHAAQFNMLGVDLYTDFFVRGFLRTGAHFTVPLEAHAFALDSKFAQNPAVGFSVEDQIRLWIKEGRY
jgi:hypothetical protein